MPDDPADSPEPDEAEDVAAPGAHDRLSEIEKLKRQIALLTEAGARVAGVLADTHRVAAELELAAVQREQAQQLKDLTDAARYSEALKLHETRHEAELNEIGVRTRALAEELVRFRVEVAVARSPTAFRPAIRDIVDGIICFLGVDDQFQPFVKDQFGQPRKSRVNRRDDMPIEEFVAEYLSSRPCYRVCPTPPGSGTSPGEGDGGGRERFSADRAEHDGAYLAEWERRDPDTVDREWATLLQRKREQRRSAK